LVPTYLGCEPLPIPIFAFDRDLNRLDAMSGGK